MTETVWQLDHLLHGGDYYPEQWQADPDILAQDMAYMQEAKITTATVGVFAWSALAPREGEWHFAWLDQVFDQLAAIGVNVILATPSGAKPAWLARRYPSVLRTDENGQRQLYGERHNHCLTDPVYRRYVAEIDRRLADRYGQRSNLLLWHISNEYSGACYCDQCQAAFRDWLKQRYGNLAALNEAWATTFWSHQYDDWAEVTAPMPSGNQTNGGQNVDWQRFVSAQTIDFYDQEVKAVRAGGSQAPVTTNFMAETGDLLPYHQVDYAAFAKHVDVVAWDAYPGWNEPKASNCQVAMKNAFINDYFRGLKQANFLLMESAPSLTNWHPNDRVRAKRPGQLKLTSLQFLAHGADSVMYFQWRQSRGGWEKFHGAVVGHDGSDQQRVFQEVSQVGQCLTQLQSIVGVPRARAKVAILFDQENVWHMANTPFTPLNRRYWHALQQQYQYFWEQDIPVDVLPPDAELSGYQLVFDLMAYATSSALEAKLTKFVRAGGTLVMGYLSALVDTADRAVLGGFSPVLRELLGIYRLEVDSLFPETVNTVAYRGQQYQVTDTAEVITLTGAVSLATYTADFYAGTPAVTYHSFGQGHAYYLASHNDQAFSAAFNAQLVEDLGLARVATIKADPTVSVQRRATATGVVDFVLNFTDAPRAVIVNTGGVDLLMGHQIDPGTQTLARDGVMAIQH